MDVEQSLAWSNIIQYTYVFNIPEGKIMARQYLSKK